MLKSYLKKICEIIQRGDAREETYYSTLEKLLQEYTDSINRKDIKITTLPGKQKLGTLILGYGMGNNILSDISKLKNQEQIWMKLKYPNN